MKHYKSIYLAGPDVFLPNAIEIGQRKKELCSKYGFIGHFPFNNEVNFKNFSSVEETGMEISRLNEKKIIDSDIIIANITPFRGSNADVGTVYEIGFGRANGKLIVAYTNVSLSHYERIAHTNFTTDLVDSHGMSIENFNLIENLMIDGGIKASRGFIVKGDVAIKERYTSLIYFEECLIRLQKLVA